MAHDITGATAAHPGTRLSRPIFWPLTCNYGIHIFGYLVVALPKPLAYLALFGSFLCFSVVINDFNLCFGNAITWRARREQELRYGRSQKGSPAIPEFEAASIDDDEFDGIVDSLSLWLAWISCVGAWCSFPVLFVGLITGTISYATFEAGFSIADVVAKVFLTFILTNANFELTILDRYRREAALSRHSKRLEKLVEMLGREVHTKLPLTSIGYGFDRPITVTSPRFIPYVTAVTADIARFDVWATDQDSGAVLRSARQLWLECDELCKRFQVTRTDILGESYVAVSGFPVESSTTPTNDCRRAVEFAIELLSLAQQLSQRTGRPIDLRIGIHLGSAAVAYLEGGGESTPGSEYSDLTASPLDMATVTYSEQERAGDRASVSKWFLGGNAVEFATELKVTSKPGCIHISDAVYHSILGTRAFVVEGPECVFGVDPSTKMLESAKIAPNITYKLGSEHDIPVPEGSVDLVAAAQCAHWFDTEAFISEVRRVLRPHGTIALWGYSLVHVRDKPLLTQLLRETAYGTGEGQVGPYWEDGRKILENKYESIKLPFKEQKRIYFPSPTEGTMIDLDMPLPAFRHYVGTWSSYKHWKEDPKNNGKSDPLDAMVAKIAEELGGSGDETVVQLEWQGVLILATVD
ncbi:hypothetical protein HDU93_005133 [Gonapodya sp. JEL0774]|nr:hypothetical protein HDU93_005133 [Gonapodya sp. JEL0774]